MISRDREREIVAIAEALGGTAEREPDDLMYWPMEELELFDSIVMNCAQCGWWVSSDQIIEEDICEDCVRENGED